MKKMLFAIAVTAVFASCEKNEKPFSGIRMGEQSKFQHGQAYTWVEVDQQNKPLKIAITMDAAAMNTLDMSMPGSEGHHHENSLSLDLPSIPNLPYTHALLDWNPQGHEPAGIYTIPHFDFHFYTMSEVERKAIPPYEVDSSKFLITPAPAYLPPTYISPAAGVPQMGRHWIDFTTPELNGAVFTQTFLYGSYDGKVIFYEPMITKAFIDASASFERAIPQPTKYQLTGYYPTVMKITKQGQAVTVSLENFVFRTAS